MPAELAVKDGVPLSIFVDAGCAHLMSVYEQRAIVKSFPKTSIKNDYTLQSLRACGFCIANPFWV